MCLLSEESSRDINLCTVAQTKIVVGSWHENAGDQQLQVKSTEFSPAFDQSFTSCAIVNDVQSLCINFELHLVSCVQYTSNCACGVGCHSYIAPHTR